MNPTVYLAGPIRGLNYNEAVEWRERTTLALHLKGIDALSPMRGKTYLAGVGDVGNDKLKDHYAEHPLSTSKAILCRDFRDCSNSDAVIMYLKGAQSVSMGSVMEVAWAHAARVPIILVMEKTGNVHEHGLLTEACNVRVETIEEAIKVVCAILLPTP